MIWLWIYLNLYAFVFPFYDLGFGVLPRDINIGYEILVSIMIEEENGLSYQFLEISKNN